jgi:hypothetical protein
MPLPSGGDKFWRMKKGCAMQETSVSNIMIVVAVATFVVGLLALGIGRMTATQADEPMPAGMRRNALLLTLAGPLALGLWFLFNRVLEGTGYRSAVGYALAALVFIAGGFMTGLFARLTARRRGERSDGLNKDNEEQ